MKNSLLVFISILVLVGMPAELKSDSAKVGEIVLGNTLEIYQLTGKWRFMPEDSLQYASPEYDDSSWMWISVPGVWNMMDIEFTEHAWYRFRFQLSPKFAKVPIGIRVPAIYDSHELYVNGRLIGGAGKILPDGTIVKKSSVPGVYRVPESALNEKGWNVIALRIADNVGWGGITKSEFLIGRYELLDLQFKKFVVWNSALFLILIFLGLFFLTVYKVHNREPSFLYFSLLTIVSSLMLFGYSSLSYLFIDSFWLFHLVGNSGAHIAILFLFYFIYAFYDYPKDIALKFFSVTCLLLYCFLLVSPLHLTMLKFYAHFVFTIAIIIDAVGLFYVFYLLIKGVILKKQEAKIVGVGSLVVFGCILSDIIGYLLALNIQQTMMEGIVVFMISISFAMFLRYTKIDSSIMQPVDNGQ